MHRLLREFLHHSWRPLGNAFRENQYVKKQVKIGNKIRDKYGKESNNNEAYEQPKRTGLDCSELFDLLREWFDDLNNSAITPGDLWDEISNLLMDNKHISFTGSARYMREEPTKIEKIV